MTLDEFTQWLARSGAACIADNAPHLLAADDVLGAWRVVAYLARGGSAEVYRVVRPADGQVGALKIARHPENPECTARFAREAELLQRLAGDGFPHLLDQGAHDRRPWIVLDLLRPFTLPRTDKAVAACAIEVARALDRLHREDYVHRDVKPTNLLTRDGTTPILVDLGFAKTFSDEPAAPTVIDSVSIEQTHYRGVGTPGYAAPEQFMDRAVSPATDIHALGVLLDACFRGNPPRCWQAIIRRCTSSLPRQRYDSMAAFVRAVETRHVVRRRWCLAGAAAALLLVGALAYEGVVFAVERYEDIKSRVFVRADAAPGGDGSAERPFNSISNALATVPWFGTVHVGPGRYRECPVVEKCLTLVADEGPEKTILDGSGEKTSVVTFRSGATGSLLDGFTVTGGLGTFMPGSEKDSTDYDFVGGGVFCCVATTIRDCHIVGNGRRRIREGEPDPKRLGYSINTDERTTSGGGLYVYSNQERDGTNRMEVTVSVQNCTISNNFAWAVGGGVVVSGRNVALFLNASSVVDNASDGFVGGRLGGLALQDHAYAEVNACTFARNEGQQIGAPGGVDAEGTRLAVAKSRIEGGLRRGNLYRIISADAASLRNFKAFAPPGP